MLQLVHLTHRNTLIRWLLHHACGYSRHMACEYRTAGPIRTAAPGSGTTARLIRPTRHPDRIAVSKTGSFIDGGAFFLDFARPLEIHRRFGRIDRHVGLIVALLVPVVHEGEEHGRYVIGVHRSDPRFEDLCALWSAHYPAQELPPERKTDVFTRLIHFAAQFPNDHRSACAEIASVGSFAGRRTLHGHRT
jgi:hypothetical protein